MSETLVINEIYTSIQGESTWAGLPCVFIRLTACDLRCSYCDSEFAFYEGNKRELTDIVTEVIAKKIPLVEVTGGEPLLQKNVLHLIEKLCDLGKTVLIETSGAHDIGKVDPRAHRIMDLKTPDSSMCDRNMMSNIEHLTKSDEVKFVISSREDYEWSREVVLSYSLDQKVRAVLFSTVFGKQDPKQLVDWVLEDRLPVRFQLQMHKFIWQPDERGV